MIRLIVLAGALAWTAELPAAELPPMPRSEVADRTIQGLTAALDAGVNLYNRGDHLGCYRVYLGAILAVKPMLATDPELAAKVQARVDRATGLPSAAHKALELRAAIDEIRWQWRRPLWDRLGGESGVTLIVHDFLTAAGPDPKVNFLRDGKYKLDNASANTLARKLVELISEAGGGPLKYSGRDMRSVHADMKITDAEFNALVGHLVAALKKNRVGGTEIDELVGIVNQTRKEIVQSGSGASSPPVVPTIPPPAARKPLWDRLGGEEEIKAIVHEFVLSAATDPKVNFFRSGEIKLDADGIGKLERKLVEFISSVSGGPLKYTGKDMKAAHAGMKITDDEFSALATHLVAALRKFRIPQAETDELMNLVGGTRKEIVGH